MVPKQLKTNNFLTNKLFIVHRSGCNLVKDFDQVSFAVLFIFPEISGEAVLVLACLIIHSQVLDISYLNYFQYQIYNSYQHPQKTRKSPT